MRRSSVAALPCERMADITAERFRLVKMSVTDRASDGTFFRRPDSIAFPGVLRPHDGEDLARAFALIRVGQETDLVFEVAGFDQTVGEHGRDENDVLFPARDQFRAGEVERMEAECRHSARVVVLQGNEALLPARGQGARFGRQSVSILAERAVKQGNLADGAGNQIGFFRRVQRAHIGLAGNVERRRHRGKRPQNRLAAQHQNHGLIGDRTGGADDVLKLGARHGRTPA